MAPQRNGSESEENSQGWKPEELPRHVAMIMDGNGRWARRRGLLRLRGHEQGAEALRRVSRRCRALGIREVTFYALSTENYTRRPATEVTFLMRLLKSFLISERSEMLDNDIRLKSIGDVEEFPSDVLDTLRESERLTAQNHSMVLRLALNYGARQEMLRAVARVVDDVQNGRLASEQAKALDDMAFRRYFYDAEMSDPDLLIRTAGEYRLSNFLLWQCSYAELWITDSLWPEFDEAQLELALDSYVQRERKYGAVGGGRGAEAASTQSAATTDS